VNRCLTEGRRRFHDRLAGIESGAECERLAPLLSALADGEARAEDMAALRPHLRTCLVCRARLRDYRAVPARVAAVAPPVAIGFSLLDSGRFLLDAAGGWLSGRSASLALRWHQAAELAAGHKVAAVVASTAALAGGGAVTVATVDGGDRPAAAQPSAGASVAPSAPSGNESAERRGAKASNGGGTRRAAPRGEPAHADRDPAAAARAAGESTVAAPSGEFTPDPAPAEPFTTKAERPARAAGSEPEGGEFAP
jgi:hypothetical protein